MRDTTLCLTYVAALSLLLAVGPATRPSAGPYHLRVCRYDGKVAVVTAEFSADLGRPFSNTTRMGNDTLTISGTVQPTGQHNGVRLSMTYKEVHADPNYPAYREVSTCLELDLGQELNLGGGPGDTRIAVMVTQQSQS